MEVRKQEETTTRATKGERDRPRMEGLGDLDMGSWSTQEWALQHKAPPTPE